MFRDLYDHMSWADATVWQAVLASEAARDDQRIRDLLLHLHMTQTAFLMVWRNEELQFPKADPLTVGREFHSHVTAVIADVKDDALDDEFVLPWAQHYRKDSAPTTLRDTLLQVPLHTTHHRGQVLARLRELGVEPPLVDYIAWVWMGRPRAEWP